jgi:hypothetical protein
MNCLYLLACFRARGKAKLLHSRGAYALGEPLRDASDPLELDVESDEGVA